MSYALSQSGRTFGLIFGVVEALGAALWCLAGAGIYGSPIAGMQGPELAQVGAFLLTGPLSAFAASIVLFWRPRWGAAWLVAGGLASGALAVHYFSTDAQILPLAIVSVPMLGVGLWVIRASSSAAGGGTASGHLVEPGGQQDLPGGMGSALLGVLRFLVAVVGTYALFIALAVNNITGLRGTIRSDNPFVHENQDLADGVVVLFVATLVTLITSVRKRLRLRGEVVAGMWLAVFLGGLVIRVR